MSPLLDGRRSPMGSFLPWRRQQRVLHGGWRSGHPLGLLLLVLVVTWHAPLPAAAQVDKGGTIVWAVHESMPSFDLHYDNSYIVAQPISPIYNGLLTFDVYNHEQIIGDLAERWDIASDGTQITFALRKGVQFHDGSDFTCTDAKYSLDNLADLRPISTPLFANPAHVS